MACRIRAAGILGKLASVGADVQLLPDLSDIIADRNSMTNFAGLRWARR